MTTLIESVSQGVPAALSEIITLGRTLTKRAADVLAYFDRPGTSNGPTEAINGRLEHLRGSALGFRNLTNYIARSLLETGGFRPRLHPQSSPTGNVSKAISLGRGGTSASMPAPDRRYPQRSTSTGAPCEYVFLIEDDGALPTDALSRPRRTTRASIRWFHRGGRAREVGIPMIGARS